MVERLYQCLNLHNKLQGNAFQAKLYSKNVFYMGSTGEPTDQDMLAPDLLPFHPKLLGQGRFKPPVVVVRLDDGDLNAVGWVEGP